MEWKKQAEESDKFVKKQALDLLLEGQEVANLKGKIEAIRQKLRNFDDWLTDNASEKVNDEFARLFLKDMVSRNGEQK